MSDSAHLLLLLKKRNLEKHCESLKKHGFDTISNFYGLNDCDSDEISKELQFSMAEKLQLRNLIKEINGGSVSPGPVPHSHSTVTAPLSEEESNRLHLFSDHFKVLDSALKSIQNAHTDVQKQFNDAKHSIREKTNEFIKIIENLEHKSIGILEQKYIDQELQLYKMQSEVESATLRAKDAETKCNQLVQQPIEAGTSPRKSEIIAITDKIFNEKIPLISNNALISTTMKFEIPQIDVKFSFCSIELSSLSKLRPKIFKSNSDLTFIRTFGKQGNNDGEFNKPSQVACNLKDGDIVICDYANNRIQMFDSKGVFIRKFGKKGFGDGEFGDLSGVSIDSSSGNIFVSDWNNHRIQVFDSNGNFLWKFGKNGSGYGEFNYPSFSIIDSDGNIVVCDNRNHRVQVLDSKGNFIRTFGNQGNSDGCFINPRGVAIDTKNNIIVCDCRNHRIQTFDSNGKFLRKFGQLGDGDGNFKHPFGVAVDQDDNIIVCDNSDRIQIFDSQGKFIKKIGHHGNGNGQFNSPSDVAIDIDGNIVVCDLNNHRIQVFGQQQ